MNTQLAITLALLFGSMLLFIRNKPRMDVVALMGCSEHSGSGGRFQ